MRFAIPAFQFRFMPALGNVIFPANFHPIGTQRAAEAMIARGLGGAARAPEGGPRWLVIGASGGFGSAARVALGTGRGAHTLGVSLDAAPNPESTNKIRTIGSPGFHRNLAIERGLRGLGLKASSLNADVFDPETITRACAAIREQLGGPLDGLVWALAAPRAVDPRTGKAVSSALRPLGRPVAIKTFGGRGDDGSPPQVVEFTIEPGSPEEAVATQYVMGGGIVDAWIRGLLGEGLLADGFTLLTISYRGNALNEGIYRKGLIGLAKADLEFHTRAIDAVLRDRVGGRSLAVEGPAVVTEASGGIPGVPFYMALLLDVMGERFEDPLDSMRRMFAEKVPAGGEPVVDAEGLVRMDDRELAADVQAELRRRFEAYAVGDAFDVGLYERFLEEYARTRGFSVEGVEYSAEFESTEICGAGSASASV